MIVVPVDTSASTLGGAKGLDRGGLGAAGEAIIIFCFWWEAKKSLSFVVAARRRKSQQRRGLDSARGGQRISRRSHN